jgi:glycosyltransferase involved in cell wall biosynthesis
MKAQKKLTIAIPTYNRASALKETLSIILPQVAKCHNVFLLILDNHSEVPALQVYESVNISIPAERLTVIRNELNIGGNANIMRCFEQCKTQWLWVLGDDDNPSVTAVDTIIDDMESCHCFAFYTVPLIKKPQFENEKTNKLNGVGFESLVSYFGKDKLEIGFLSAATFNMDLIRPYIIDGYMAANTGLPHILMAFKAIAQGHEWMISKNVLADYCPPEKGGGWGFMGLAYATTSLLGLASNNTEVCLLRDIMIKGWRPSPKKVLYSQATKYALNATSKHELRYLFKTIKNIYAPSWTDEPMLRLRWHITSIWSYFPEIFVNYYKKRKEGKATIKLENETRR